MTKTKSNHLYRVNVYLGKSLYEELSGMAQVMGISIATLTKILLNTGFEISKQLDNKIKKGGSETYGG